MLGKPRAGGDLPVGTPTTLRESRLRLVLLLLASVGFVAVSLLRIISGGFVAWAVLGIGLFGIGIVVFSLQLVRGGRTLTLDTQGLRFDNLRQGHPESIRWSDIASVRVWRPSVRGPQLVGFDLAPEAERSEHAITGVLSRAILPANHPQLSLPTVYSGLNSRELAAYLERWLAYARAHAD